MKLYKLDCICELILSSSNNYDNVCIDNNLLTLLYSTKSHIDKVSQDKWEKFKKLHNKYEYIYTSSNKSQNISDVNPISRSYFKLHEIIHDFYIKEFYLSSCIAEGPGGFINCLLDHNITNIYGITLITNERSIPYWNNGLIKNNKVHINIGQNTGNIYVKDNAINFINIIKSKGTSQFVTSDGGFDYSEDFNKQELSSYKLLFSEIFIALNIQSEGGTFIIKVFDLFYHKTVQLIYLLFLSYSEVYIYKPTVSRLSNSEKYIVCKGFKPFNKEIIDLLDKYYDNVNILHINIPQEFIDKIKEYNNLFVNNQINYIKNILKFNVKNINERIKEQVKNSYDWCVKYRIPINDDCIYLR
jgi:23S rRNA U2552 (ribose-2'-O)-methylase RlmE/FtsJ